MRDIDYYRRQIEHYIETYNNIMADDRMISANRFLEMANMVITIHRPDKLSPKKKANKFRFK
mgnify:FL=1